MTEEQMLELLEERKYKELKTELENLNSLEQLFYIASMQVEIESWEGVNSK